MNNSNNGCIVFLPGWGFKSTIWNDTIASLNAFNTRLIDLPSISKPDSLDGIMQSLNESLPTNSTIVSWSFSGLLAIRLCYQFPHKYKKLIIVNSLPKFVSDNSWLGIAKKDANYFQHQLKLDSISCAKRFISLVQYPHHSKIINEYLKHHCLINATNIDSLHHYLQLMLTLDYCELLKKLNAPIFCLLGAKDAVISLQSMQQLKTLNKNIDIDVFKEAGHIPFITHKKEFRQFLTRVMHV